MGIAIFSILIVSYHLIKRGGGYPSSIVSRLFNVRRFEGKAGKTVDYYAGDRQLPTLPLLTYSESKNVAEIYDAVWYVRRPTTSSRYNRTRILIYNKY